MTADHIYEEIQSIINEETASAENYFKNAVLMSRLKLTGDLLNSVKSKVVSLSAQNLTAELSVTFNEYWRFNDMKKLTYDNYMNFEAMLHFVNKVGVDKFPWVNGYEGKSTPTVPNAAERIARTLMFFRKKTPVVTHPNSRRKYNKTKNDFRTVLRRRLTKSMANLLTISIKETILK